MHTVHGRQPISNVLYSGEYNPSGRKPGQQPLSRVASSPAGGKADSEQDQPPPPQQQQLAPSFATLQFSQRPGKAKLAVRLQQPTLVAEVGFILAVTKFAYPSLPVSGVSPIPFRSNDLLLQGARVLPAKEWLHFRIANRRPERQEPHPCACCTKCHRLRHSQGFVTPGALPHCPHRCILKRSCFCAEPVTKAEGDMFLSPQSRLLADSPGYSEYVYDGAGHHLVLPEGIKVQDC